MAHPCQAHPVEHSFPRAAGIHRSAAGDVRTAAWHIWFLQAAPLERGKRLHRLARITCAPLVFVLLAQVSACGSPDLTGLRIAPTPSPVPTATSIDAPTAPQSTPGAR